MYFGFSVVIFKQLIQLNFNYLNVIQKPFIIINYHRVKIVFTTFKKKRSS